MFGQDCYQETNELLNRAFEEKRHLIAAHRGAWGGNIIENTIPSFRLALEKGADMFECDVARSADGILYAFHDGYEKRILGVEENIESLNSAQIDGFDCLNSLGHPSGMRVHRFEDVVSHFSAGELYNVDRAWAKMPETIAILNKYPGAIKQALLKCQAREDGVLSYLNEIPQKYMFMPIVFSWEDIHKVIRYPAINLVGMELIALSPEDELFAEEVISFLHERKLFAWVNTLNLSNYSQHRFYAGLDDQAALLGNQDASWGALMNRSVDIIQTDWPYELMVYRESRKE